MLTLVFIYSASLSNQLARDHIPASRVLVLQVGHHAHLGFMWVLEIRTLSLSLLHSKHLTYGAIYPSPLDGLGRLRTDHQGHTERQQ